MPPFEQRKTQGSVSMRFAMGLLLLVSLLVSLPLWVLADGKGPQWWRDRGVQNPDPNVPAQDYAAVNQGQVKHIAVAAVVELDTNLPGGAGDPLHALSTQLSGTSALTSDYAAVNLGQLKNLAAPFYDRLLAVGYRGHPLESGTYPWIALSGGTIAVNGGTAPIANDYAVANIGQVKNLFSFDVTLCTDGSGLPDWWRQYYNVPAGTSGTSAVPNGGGLSYLDAYTQGLDPNNPPAPPDARFGPPQIQWDGFVLTYDAKASATSPNNPQGADVYRDTSGQWSIFITSDGSVTLTGPGGVIYTGTYDPKTGLFTLPSQAGTVTALDSNGMPINQNSSGQNLITPVITAGANHSLAVDPTGTLWVWGGDTYGQLGIGYSSDVWNPLAVTLSGTAKVVSVAAGENHSAAGENHSVLLRSDGSIWCAGYNAYGALGIGATSSTNAFVQVPVSGTFIAVAAGGRHTIALKEDGTVWAWGDNYYGQLGNGTFSAQTAPVQVSGLSGIVAVAAGDNGNLALDKNGKVWSWGVGYLLGDGIGQNRATPVQIASIGNITSISTGSSHALALTVDGQIWAWGSNTFGQVGTNKNSIGWATTPYLVSGAVNLCSGTEKIIAVSAGENNSAALTSNGRVFVWGDNKYGQIASGTTACYDAPFVFSGITGIVSISAGSRYLAIGSNGTVFGWGCNGNAQVGNGSRSNVSAPVALAGICCAPKTAKPVFSPNPGAYLQSQTVTLTCQTPGSAIYYTTDGSEPTSTSPSLKPGGAVVVAQTKVLRAKAIAAGLVDSDIKSASYRIGTQLNAGENNTLELKADGTLWGWGRNDYGALGLGTSSTRVLMPTLMCFGNSLTAVSAASGSTHSVVVAGDSSVWAAGGDNFGQLGLGNYSGINTFVQVPNFDGAISVAAGEVHTLALKSDGTVWAWGYGGAIGDGKGNISSTPQQTFGLQNIIMISACGYCSYALDQDGYVWSWGNNHQGNDSKFPTRLGMMNDIIAVSSGSDHAIALKGDGTVWTWGYNTYGQLGTGTHTNASNPVTIPVQVTGTSAFTHGVINVGDAQNPIEMPIQIPVPSGFTGGVIEVAAGANHSAILTNKGTVWTWGDNQYGQIGNGTLYEQDAPMMIGGLNNAVAISAANHTLAFTSDGVLLAWGDNAYGQLGDGTTINRDAPLLLDSDLDGLPDWLEELIGSDPNNPYTNGAVISDMDAFLSGSSSASPFPPSPPTGGDPNPPVIIITEPAQGITPLP